MHLNKTLLMVLALTGCQTPTGTAPRQPDLAAAPSPSTSPATGSSHAPAGIEDYTRQIKEILSPRILAKGDFHGKKCDVKMIQPVGGPLVHVEARPEGDPDLCKAVLATILEVDRERKFPINPAKETVSILMEVRP